MPNQPIVNTSAYRGQRNFHTGSYHYCARCGSRVTMGELIWQRGLLVCTKWDCFDKGNHGFALLGQREADIAAVLTVPSHELQPDEKLITPQESGSGDNDTIIF